MRLEIPPPHLRPQFFQSVIGPIGHFVVAENSAGFARTIDDYFSIIWPESRLADSLSKDFIVSRADMFSEVRRQMRDIFQKIVREVNDLGIVPLTDAQSVAAMRFLATNKASALVRQSGDGRATANTIFNIEAISVLNGAMVLASRTRGFDLASLSDLRTYMRSEGFNDALRVLMSGPMSFDRNIHDNLATSFREFNARNSFLAFMDPDTDRININSELVKFSGDQRRQARQGLYSSEVKNYSFTSGCPLKATSFSRFAKGLKEYDLCLTEPQMEILLAGDDPVVVPYKINGSDEIYAIRRDGVAELTAMVDYVVQKFEDLLAKLPASKNPSLSKNLALIGIETSTTRQL